MAHVVLESMVEHVLDAFKGTSSVLGRVAMRRQDRRYRLGLHSIPAHTGISRRTKPRLAKRKAINGKLWAETAIEETDSVIDGA